MSRPTIRAGVPAINKAVYHRIKFLCHDPAVLIELPHEGGVRSTLIVRDVERERATVLAKTDRVIVPRDVSPAAGLSGDREIATAEAAAEFLRRSGVTKIFGDRSLPLLYVELAREAGVEIVLDTDLGVRERRQKDETEVRHLRQAQLDTEAAVEMACRLIARCETRADGVLLHDGGPLTSEIVRQVIDVFLMKRGYANADCIIAGGPVGADCHNPGEGMLRTGEPVLVDIFPMNKSTLYNGDCTRTVVHGDVPPIVRRMHDLVARAKKAAEAATKAGTTGDAVHRATVASMQADGVHIGFAPAGAAGDLLFIPHGTGHGIGLDLKEPPLLDFKGIELLAGDAVTIEPAVYANAVGGVRIEDLFIVRDDGAENLGRLPETLDWR
jgi:Xaa-Pro aminopeptidase